MAPFAVTIPRTQPTTARRGAHLASNTMTSVQREWRRFGTRRRWLLLLTVVGPGSAAFLAAQAGLAGLEGTTASPNQRMGTSLTVLAVCLSFMAVALSLTSVVNDRDVIRRELRWQVPSGAVILSRALSRTVPAVVQAVVATAVVTTVGPAPREALDLVPPRVGVLLVLTAVTLASMCLGVLISTLAASVEQAVGAMSAGLAAMAILSGLVIPLGQLTGAERVVSVAAALTPTRWGIAALAALVDGQHVGALGTDAMWIHDTAHVLVPLAVLLGMCAVALGLATVLLPRSLRRGA
jgi:ABC transport system ATP-binding/permease protein